MRHYCTLFDRNYLDRGLALHRSLLKHCGEFQLHVLCLDAATLQALSALSLPRTSLIRLETLEEWDPALRAARGDRTLVELYFTAKPVLLGYLLEGNPGMSRIEYLDSDLYFFGDPQDAEQEYCLNPVALSPHDFDARNADRTRFGLFNAGWLSVRGDAEGRRFVLWWRDRCVEWCRMVVEDTRFADQKYLDRVPGLFPGAVAVRHPGMNLAPWNIGGRRVAPSAHGVRIDGRPLVFFHFHGLRQMKFGVFDSGLHDYGLRLSGSIRQDLYRPYLRTLLACRRQLRQLPAAARERLAGAPGNTGAIDLARQTLRTARAIARRTTLMGAIWP
jgi:hypothetical protein